MFCERKYNVNSEVGRSGKVFPPWYLSKPKYWGRQTDDRPALDRLVPSMTYTAGPYFLRDKAIPQFTCFVKNNMNHFLVKKIT